MATYPLYIIWLPVDLEENMELREVEAGSTVTLTAKEYSKMDFVQWYYDGVEIAEPESRTISFTMPANEVYVEPAYDAKYIIICDEWNNYFYNEYYLPVGEVLEFEAPSVTGHQFSKWQSDYIEIPDKTNKKLTIEIKSSFDDYISIEAVYDTNKHTVFRDGCDPEERDYGSQVFYSTNYEQDSCRLTEWPVTGVAATTGRYNIEFVMPDNDVYVGSPIYGSCITSVVEYTKYIKYNSSNYWLGPHDIQTVQSIINSRSDWINAPLATAWHNSTASYPTLLVSGGIGAYAVSLANADNQAEVINGDGNDDDKHVLMSGSAVLTKENSLVLFDSTCCDEKEDTDINEWCFTQYNTVFVEPPYIMYQVPWLDVIGYRMPKKAYIEQASFVTGITPFTSDTIKAWDWKKWSKDNDCDLVCVNGAGMRYMVSYLDNIEKGVLDGNIYLKSTAYSNAWSSYYLTNCDILLYGMHSSLTHYGTMYFIDRKESVLPKVLNYLDVGNVSSKKRDSYVSCPGNGNLIQHMYAQSGLGTFYYASEGTVYRGNAPNTSHTSLYEHILQEFDSYGRTNEVFIVDLSDAQNAADRLKQAVGRYTYCSDIEREGELKYVFKGGINNNKYIFSARIKPEGAEGRIYGTVIADDYPNNDDYDVAKAIGYMYGDTAVYPDLMLVASGVAVDGSRYEKPGGELDTTAYRLAKNRMLALHPQGGWEDINSRNMVGTLVHYKEEEGELVPDTSELYLEQCPLRYRMINPAGDNKYYMANSGNCYEWCSFPGSLWGQFVVSASCDGPQAEHVSCNFMRAGELAAMSKSDIPVYKTKLDMTVGEEKAARLVMDMYPGWVYRAHIMTDMPIAEANQQYSSWALDGLTTELPELDLRANIVFKNSVCRSGFELYTRKWWENCGQDKYGHGHIFPYDALDPERDVLVADIPMEAHGEGVQYKNGPGMQVIVRKFPMPMPIYQSIAHEADEDAEYEYPGTRSFYTSKDAHIYKAVALVYETRDVHGGNHMYDDWISKDKCTIPIDPLAFDSRYKDVIHNTDWIRCRLHSTCWWFGDQRLFGNYGGWADEFYSNASIIRYKDITPKKVASTLVNEYLLGTSVYLDEPEWEGADRLPRSTTFVNGTIVKTKFDYEMPNVWLHKGGLGFFDVGVNAPPCYNIYHGKAWTDCARSRIILGSPEIDVFITSRSTDCSCANGADNYYDLPTEDGTAHAYNLIGTYPPDEGYEGHKLSYVDDILGNTFLEFVAPQYVCTTKSGCGVDTQFAIGYYNHFGHPLLDYIEVGMMEKDGPAVTVLDYDQTWYKEDDMSDFSTIVGPRGTYKGTHTNITTAYNGMICNYIDGELIEVNTKYAHCIVSHNSTGYYVGYGALDWSAEHTTMDAAYSLTSMAMHIPSVYGLAGGYAFYSTMISGFLPSSSAMFLGENIINTAYLTAFDGIGWAKWKVSDGKKTDITHVKPSPPTIYAEFGWFDSLYGPNYEFLPQATASNSRYNGNEGKLRQSNPEDWYKAICSERLPVTNGVISATIWNPYCIRYDFNMLVTGSWNKYDSRSYVWTQPLYGGVNTRHWTHHTKGSLVQKVSGYIIQRYKKKED